MKEFAGRQTRWIAIAYRLNEAFQDCDHLLTRCAFVEDFPEPGTVAGAADRAPRERGPPLSGAPQCASARFRCSATGRFAPEARSNNSLCRLPPDANRGDTAPRESAAVR